MNRKCEGQRATIRGQESGVSRQESNELAHLWFECDDLAVLLYVDARAVSGGDSVGLPWQLGASLSGLALQVLRAVGSSCSSAFLDPVLSMIPSSHK